LSNEETLQTFLITGLNIQRFYLGSWQVYIEYYLSDGTTYSNLDGYAYLRLMGVSNYEVTP